MCLFDDFGSPAIIGIAIVVVVFAGLFICPMALWSSIPVKVTLICTQMSLFSALAFSRVVLRVVTTSFPTAVTTLSAVKSLTFREAIP